jgi:poly-gamma-glutamate synthesis protein (capsule biosynthesis protein)
VSVASLANNHIGDFGEAGLLQTLRVLDAAGIAHAGAGVELGAARDAARVTSRGVKIAVVAFADYPAAWAATPSSPGFNYTRISVDDEHFAPVARCIEVARRDADLVVFSIHWGPNMRARPTDNFRRFARRVIEVGADVFWGHSAHVVQGLEVYRGKLILYDTGDFVDDYAVHEDLRNDLSALFVLRIAPPAIERVDLVLVQIGKMQVNLAAGAARAWLVRRLTRLCAEMGTTLSEGPAGLGVSIAAPPPGSELIGERCQP